MQYAFEELVAVHVTEEEQYDIWLVGKLYQIFEDQGQSFQ